MQLISAFIGALFVHLVGASGCDHRLLMKSEPINSCPADTNHGYASDKFDISDKLTAHLNTLHPQSVHVISNVDGSGYLNWQARIQYHTFQRNRSPLMTGFTRLMHRKDREMKNWAAHCEIPTVQVEPSDWRCDAPEGCPYVPKERIFTTLKFLQHASDYQTDLIKGRWILIVDADILFRGAVIAGDANDSTVGARGGPFRYMKPNEELVNPVLKRLFQLTDEQVSAIPSVAMNTCLMRVEDLYRALHLAWDYQLRTLFDAEAEASMGWIKEMWAFAAALSKLEIPITADPRVFHDNPYWYEGSDEAPMMHISYELKLAYRDDPTTVLWQYIKYDFKHAMYFNEFPKLSPLDTHALNWTRRPTFAILERDGFDHEATAKSLPHTQWMVDAFERASRELGVGGRWDCPNCRSVIPYISADPSELYF